MSFPARCVPPDSFPAANGAHAATVLTPAGDVLASTARFREISSVNGEPNLVRFAFGPDAKNHYPDWDEGVCTSLLSRRCNSPAKVNTGCYFSQH